MKLYEVGGKSKAVCASCSALVSSTFQYTDVPFDDGSGMVRDILVGVCDECGTVVSIPAQSTPAIRRAHETAVVPLEAILPAPDLDLLDIAAYRVDNGATVRFRKSLLTFYIHKLAADPESGPRLREHAELLKAKNTRPIGRIPKRRFSCKISRRTNEEFGKLLKASGVGKTRLVRCIVREIGNELVIPDQPNDLPRLRDIASVVNG